LFKSQSTCVLKFLKNAESRVVLTGKIPQFHIHPSNGKHITDPKNTGPKYEYEGLKYKNIRRRKLTETSNLTMMAKTMSGRSFNGKKS